MTTQYKFRYYLFEWSFCAMLCSAPLLLMAQTQVYAHAKSVSYAVAEQPRPLVEVLKDVQNHFKVSFVYESKTVEGKQVIAPVNYNDKVERVLTSVLGSAGLRYKKINKQTYSILPKQEARPRGGHSSGDYLQDEMVNVLYTDEGDRFDFVSAEGVLEPILITGKITDDADSPIPGVNIIIKGTSIGTTTDTEGRYSLDVPDENAVLVVSFIGFTTQEVTVGARSEINIKLMPDVQQLNEVVVVGYGTQKRSSVTGAVATVTAKDVTALSVPSVASAIQGRVPGVSVVNNGSPGAAPIVRIRGIGSISYNSDPLYVIDGFPSNANINNIDTKDIESVEVLKDAAAAAIYGSRAANGVILITTKKGSKDNKFHVDVDSYYGVQRAWKQLDLLNRDEYLRYGTQMITNAAGTIPDRFSSLDQPIYDGATQTYAQTDTDWQDEMFRTAPISQTQVGLSTGTDKFNLYTSASYFNQDGIMLGTDFERYSFRLNSEYKISKHVAFGQNLNISTSTIHNEKQSGARTQVQHMVHQVPYIPVKDPTKIGGYRAPDNNDGTDPENPVRIALQDVNKTNLVNIFGNGYVEITTFSWLKYRFTAGVNFSTTRLITKLPIYNDGFNGRTVNQVADKRTNSYSPVFSNQITFDKTFGKHYVNAIVVGERQDFKDDGLDIGANQSRNIIEELRGATGATINDGFKEERILLSYLGRINYEYGGKYLVSASFRRDGYSAFAPGHKWGNFPGVSVGWRISEEPFLKSVAAISELKLRASYGSIGFSGIGAYDWVSTVGLNTGYPFNNKAGGVVGAYFDKLPNYELEWEITKMTNVGVDVGVLGNSLTFSAEVYNRKVDNLILGVPIAPSLGYTQVYPANIGSMKNWGFEFQAAYSKATGDFRYNLSANIGVTRNEVLNLDNPSATIFAGSNADFGGFDITKTEGGQSMQGFFGWRTDGIFRSQAEIDAANAVDGNAATKFQDNAAPGDIRFKDMNGDGVINGDDRTYLGSYIPDFNYGINFSANYKDFDVTLFVQGVQGNELYNGTKVLTQGMLRLFGAEKDVLNAWTPENSDSNIPRAISGDPNQNSRTSDRFVESGSYMRIKNLSIGYSIPVATLQSLTRGSVSRIRLYVSAQNLLTLTDYSGYDPEIGTRTVNNSTPLLTNGVDYGQYPSPRTFLAGIQVGF